MEKYDPLDTRIHDPELSQQMSEYEQIYLPRIEELQAEYIGTLLLTREAEDIDTEETEKNLQRLREQIKNEKSYIIMFQWDLMVRELNRCYHENMTKF